MSDYGIALFEQHAKLLRESAISPEVARQRNYQSVDTKTRLAKIDIPKSHHLVPGLLIPVYGPASTNGEAATWQYRPDHPRIDAKGKPVKYVTAMRGMVMDVPHAVKPHIGDPDRPLWITEGIRKVDSAVTHGLDCLGVLGVWNWRGTNPAGGTTALGAWEHIALNGRDIFVCFDSDVMVKSEVRKALDRFCGFLEYRKAVVKLVILPDTITDGKCGLDDYLASGGTVDQLRAEDRIIWPSELSRFTPQNHRATVPPPPPRKPVDPPLIASDLRILDRFRREVRTLGVVGEETTACTTYLAATTRLFGGEGTFSKPVSLTVKGHSASGKSFTTQATMRFFPPEAYIEWTAMSERALIYSDQDYRHKTLVIYEATALREGNEDNLTAYFVRSLLSEGRIEYPVTVKDPNGGFTTKTIVKEGPTNMVLTTTKTAIHSENETRALSLNTDDSREQTGRVLAQIASEHNTTVDLDEWRQLQAWLSSAEHRVTVPYSGRLAELIPPVAVRLRRDFGAVLALVRAHAMLHQLNRDRDESGRIVATVDDYAVVRDLIGDVVSEGVGATVSPTVRETVHAVAALELTHSGGVTAVELADRLNLDKSAARRRLLMARDGGYVKNLEEKRGRPGRWATADPLPDEQAVLPVADKLAPPPPPVPPLNPQVSPEFPAGGGTVARAPEGVKDEHENGTASVGSMSTCQTCRRPMKVIEHGQIEHPAC